VASKVDEIATLQSRLMLDAADRFTEVKAILTPAQLKTLAEKADQLGLMCMGTDGQCEMMGGCAMGGGHKMMGGTPPMVPGAVKPPAGGQKIEGAICPVMKQRIPDITKAAGHSVYNGKTYYFCCAGCKPKFDKNPAQYLK
jgi:YHS domain-containing protein